MPSLRSVGLWFALGAGVSACGGSTVSASAEDGSTKSPDASTDGPDNRLDATMPPPDGTVAIDGGGAPDTALSPSCPASPPQGGASCSPAGLQCEYGSSYHFECDVVATCDMQTGKWSIQTANCSNFDAGGCPDPSTTGLDGTSCSTTGASCNLTTQHCDCQLGCGAVFADGGRWVCDGPQTGCPEPRPRLGSTCTTEGQQCDYTLCCAGGTMTCQGGLWQGHLMGGGCP